MGRAVAAAGDVHDGYCQVWSERLEAMEKGPKGSTLMDCVRTLVLFLDTSSRRSESGLDEGGRGRPPLRLAGMVVRFMGRWSAGGAFHPTSWIPSHVEDCDSQLRSVVRKCSDWGLGSKLRHDSTVWERASATEGLEWVVAPTMVQYEV